MGKVGARTRVAAVLGVLLVTLVASTGAGASPGPAGAGSAGAPRLDVVGEMAAAQLAEDHDVPLAEARRRVQRQEALFGLADDYQDQVGAEWAGAFIDHGDGGKLVVQTGSTAATERAAAADLAGDAGVDVDVEVRTVRHTIVELDRAGREAVARVQATGVDAAMLIDVEANRTELLADAPAAADTVAPRVVEDVNDAQAAGGADVVVLSEQSAPEEIACQAINTLCDPPLRGGVGMSTALGTTLCTTGFNVYSATDLRAYVLTAGHCLVEDPFTWFTRFADGSLHDIGARHSEYLSDDPRVDVGLVAVANPAAPPYGWGPRNHVVVFSSGGSRPTTRNELYPITGVGSSSAVPGGYLCKTGAMYRGTVCGEFIGAGRTHDNGTPGTGDDLHNLGVVRMEGCKGDSGGPIYIGNRGYGMTVRGSGIVEWISRPTGLGIFHNVPCYDLTWYEGLAGALELTNTRLRTG